MTTLHSHVVASETGESSFAVRITTGDHEFIGDEPVAEGGSGLGPSPFELLTAALAECTAMTVRWFARKQGWPVDHVKVVVDYQKKSIAGAHAPVDSFEKTLFIQGSLLTSEQRERLLDIASKCPVQRALEGSPSISTQFGLLDGQPSHAAPTRSSIDYDATMQANLARVFNERDPSRRLHAIRELYDEEAQLHEPQGSVRGHEAISQAVTDLLAHLPPDFVFTPVRPAVGQNGVGRLQWTSGPKGEQAAVTGTDVAHFEGGLIRALYVFLDQQEA